MVRRFVERDHPRWPSGSGDKSGEFRDKTPDLDWAGRLSGRFDGDATPAGRHGSVATGLTQKCPICGRTVKVVGAGKLSTHNNPKTGRRCTGSGLAATVKVPEGIQKAPGTRTPAKKTPAQKKKGLAGRPPPGPQVTYGSPLQPVNDPEARARLERWRYGAMLFDSDAARQAKIYQARRDIKSWEQGLTRARYRAQRSEAASREGLQSWDYISPQLMAKYADSAERAPDVQYQRSGLENRQRQLQDLLDAGPSGFDPANPLAYYGDMLHVESSDWHTYEVLDELEQRIPPVFHRAVAEYLRDQQRSVLEAGIYIGSSQNIRDLDGLKQKLTRPPRGWRNSTMATWEQVDGVVAQNAVYAVVHTPNAEDHRSSRRAAMRRSDIWDARPTGSASLHEFGHLLDSALGFYENPYRTRPSGASEQRRWRLVHGEVKRQATWLSPYFKQKGNAGPEEFWADAFYTWGAVDPTPWSGQAALIEFRDSKRRLTLRDVYMAEHYGLPMRTAVKVVDYFDRLEREVTTGKRLPVIEQIPASP